jgi:hypothetical protein
VCPLVSETPFQPKVTFKSLLGVLRDQRDEQRAVVDLLTDLPIPGVATAQLALVEPGLNPGSPEGIASLLRSLSIL